MQHGLVFLDPCRHPRPKAWAKPNFFQQRRIIALAFGKRRHQRRKNGRDQNDVSLGEIGGGEFWVASRSGNKTESLILA